MNTHAAFVFELDEEETVLFERIVDSIHMQVVEEVELKLQQLVDEGYTLQQISVLHVHDEIIITAHGVPTNRRLH